MNAPRPVVVLSIRTGGYAGRRPNSASVTRPPTMSETIRLPETDRLDEHLSLLADSERRTIITHLQDASTDTASLGDLATALAAHTPCDRNHARIRLHHSHLPRLAQTPLLSYDPATTTVEYHGHPELETLLDIIQTHETPPPNTEP